MTLAAKIVASGSALGFFAGSLLSRELRLVNLYFAPNVTPPKELPPSAKKGRSLKNPELRNAFFTPGRVGSDMGLGVPTGRPGRTPPTRAPLTGNPGRGKKPRLTPPVRDAAALSPRESRADRRSGPLRSAGELTCTFCATSAVKKTSRKS